MIILIALIAVIHVFVWPIRVPTVFLKHGFSHDFPNLLSFVSELLTYSPTGTLTL